MKRIVVLAASLTLSVVTSYALPACAVSDEGDRSDEDAATAIPLADGSPGLDQVDASVDDAGIGPPCDGGADPACERPKSCATAHFCEEDANLDARYSLLCVRGTSRNDVWASGAAGTVVHYDGTRWAKVPTNVFDTLRSLWVTGQNEIWLTGSTTTLLRGQVAPDGGVAFTDLGGAAPGPVIAYPYNAILGAPNGQQLLIGLGWGAWDPSRPPPGRPPQPLGQGKSLLLRNKEGAWASVGVNGFVSLSAFGGTGADIWRVGPSGHAARAIGLWEANGEAPWLAFDTQTSRELTSVIAFPDGSVWAVGLQGVVRRFGGGSVPRFDVVAVPTTSDLYGIWGTSSTNLWVVGKGGTILHYDGNEWTRPSLYMKNQGNHDFYAIWGSGPKDVWVVGKGVIVRLHPDVSLEAAGER